MSKITRCSRSGWIIFSLGGALFAFQSHAIEQPIPDLSSLNFGWVKANREFVAPETGPGLITSDKAHPYVSIYSPRIADVTNPISKRGQLS
jgi:hypothetical protein